MKSRMLIGLVALAMVVAPGLYSTPDSKAAAYVFETQMFGTNNVPAVDTVAWGFFRFFWNEDRTSADISLDVKGLAAGSVTGADIHRGAPGTNGPIVKHLSDGGFIVSAATATFSRAELEEMIAGGWYISLKTTDHPNGALRGQIMPPADFLPGAALPPAPTPPPAQGGQPVTQQPGTNLPDGGIRPPSTGDGGLVQN